MPTKNSPKSNPEYCKEMSIWALDVLSRARMKPRLRPLLTDTEVKVKWALPVRIYYKNPALVYRYISLDGMTRRGAVYAAMCGIVLPPDYRCKKCRNGYGVFACSIVLPSYLRGACAGCHYLAANNKCSFQPGTYRPVRR
ncbi:hypothetical protein GGR52DRAFT_237973 [Hypoxylon sp. FL1284]|nr:hypothetical protein GGR52DRAFT_237973 [Hypoxylon sp. FL1284]